MLQDLRFALRGLLRVPAFAVAAVVCIALGVGANAAIFSVVNGVLLRPLPYRDPDGLVVVWERRNDGTSERNVASPANLLDWKASARSFTDLGAVFGTRSHLTGDGEPEELQAQAVTPNTFAILGVSPALGRGFTAEDAVQGAPRVVVLSDALWRRRFGADPQLVGRSIQLSGRPATVVGVMPPRFDIIGTKDVDVWATLNIDPAVDYRAVSGRFLTVLGRLRPGVAPERAQAELSAIARRLEAEHPQFNAQWGVNVLGVREQMFGEVRRPLAILSGVVAFVLLIACANVASLQLARAAARRREVAVRAALGADRWQIARAVIAEAMLVSVAGGALGLGLAALGVRALAAAGPRDVPRLAELAVDGRVVAFTALVSVVAGLLFAVAPALHAARGALGETLRQGGRGSVGARQVARTVLVGAQAALSLILLVGAGLMLKSFWRLQQVDPGFRAEGVLTARVGAPGARYPSPEQARQLLTQLVERARAVPGVRAAGGTTSLPLGGFVQATGIEFAGRPKAAPGEGPSAQVAAVSGEYFRAMGIPVLRGTAFTGAERAGGPTQVIVNQALAAKYFANEDPIGRRIIMEWGDTLDATIVGVVGDTRQTGLDSIPEPVTYWSLAQLLPSTRVTIVARYTGVDAASVAAGFRAAVKEVDPLLPIADVKTLDAYLSESVAQRRLNTVLLGAFAAAALLLAAVGVYGVVAYAVAQRTREIGLRVALGATRGGVMRLVVGQGLRVVGAGAAVGVLGAFALTRVLASQLYGVSPTDVPTFVGVPLLLVAVAAAASAAPARRAARVDPQTALREE